MPKEKDIQILHHLRKNSRETLTSISKKMNIPVTTIYDRLLINESKYIKRHTSLLDFSKLGFPVSMFLSFKIIKGKQNDFEKFLKSKHNINSAYKTDFEGNYLIEFISENSANANKFVNELEKDFGTHKLQMFNIIEELSREAVLTNQEHVKFLTGI